MLTNGSGTSGQGHSSTGGKRLTSMKRGAVALNPSVSWNACIERWSVGDNAPKLASLSRAFNQVRTAARALP